METLLKARCQDPASSKQDTFGIKLLLFQPRGESCASYVTSFCQKEIKVQNTEFLRQRFCGNFFLILLISLPTTKQLGKMWRPQSTNEILKRRENFKRSDIKSKIYKKPVSASQLEKNCIQNVIL